MSNPGCMHHQTKWSNIPEAVEGFTTGSERRPINNCNVLAADFHTDLIEHVYPWHLLHWLQQHRLVTLEICQIQPTSSPAIRVTQKTVLPLLQGAITNMTVKESCPLFFSAPALESGFQFGILSSNFSHQIFVVGSSSALRAQDKFDDDLLPRPSKVVAAWRWDCPLWLGIG